jgi:hypothetical protein
MHFEVTDVAQLSARQEHLASAATNAFNWCAAFKGTPLEWLQAAKFTTVGFDPYEPSRALNLVEQINQTWSLIAGLEATRLLFTLHPKATGFKVAVGAKATQPYDIMSFAPGLVVAEVFSATSPSSNQKLAKDRLKLSSASATNRYCFFLSPKYPTTMRHPKLERDGVMVWSVAPPVFGLKPPPPAPRQSQH